MDAVQVQLDWKIQQEQPNKGFFVERKLQHESEFKVVQFVNSKAPTGNSSLWLQYNITDANAFDGKSFYRLKQVTWMACILIRPYELWMAMKSPLR